MNEQIKKIHNQKLMGYLCLRGFCLQGLEENKIHKGKNVFLFKESEELIQAIKDYRPFIDKYRKLLYTK